MATQINIDGNIIHVDGEMTYNFQLGDISDFSRMKSNYTSSFRIPRTTENVRIFEGLGIPADSSNVPYRITNVQCMDNYVIVYEGSLIIMNTDKLYYHCTILSGINDLGSILGDYTLHDVLQDDVLLKLPSVVGERIISTSPSPVTYFTLNRFGGVRNIPEKENGINVDTIAQSFEIKYIMDEIFNLAGFTYTLPASIDLTDEMLTVPLPPVLGYIRNGEFNIRAERFVSTTNISPPVDNPGVQGWNLWVYGMGGGVEMVNETNPNVNSRFIRFISSGNYIIRIPQFIASMWQLAIGDRYGMIIELLLDNRIIGRFRTTTIAVDEEYIYQTIVTANAGSELTYRIISPPELDLSTNRQYQIISGMIEIYDVALDQDKIKPYMSFKLIDFVKEICYRYQLIPSQDGNHIDFLSYYDILEDWDVVDWSDKYIQRSEEGYTLNYAKLNWLRHSYAEDGADDFDLSLDTNNMNMPASKNIVESKIYAPVNNEYLTYEQDNDTYNHKTNVRFYFIKRQVVPSLDNMYFVSGTVPGGFRPLGISSMNTGTYTAAFSDSERWKSLERIIGNIRTHNIDLNLTPVDVYDLDIGKVYFFKQESSFYILNRLQYTKGQISKGEFIKVPCDWV